MSMPGVQQRRVRKPEPSHQPGHDVPSPKELVPDKARRYVSVLRDDACPATEICIT